MEAHTSNTFQFHKVRLKEFGYRWFTLLNLFQFHKVRLKGLEGQETSLFHMFQFHKVRLKAWMGCTSYSKREVSIP